MYTLKDYWTDIITHAKRLDKYLTPYDIKVVNTCLEASCGTLTSTINEIVSDIEYIHQFALCKEAMRTAKLVQEDNKHYCYSIKNEPRIQIDFNNNAKENSVYLENLVEPFKKVTLIISLSIKSFNTLPGPTLSS